MSTKKYYEANKEVIKAKQRAWYQANKVSALARRKEWGAENKEKISTLNKAWYEANKASALAQKKEYYQRNKNKISESKKRHREIYKEKLSTKRQNNREHYAAIEKAYRDRNPEAIRAKTANRRCSKLQRTPAWAKNDPRIKEIYRQAKLWGMEVDHVLPLQGKLVSGLHCWENLQLLHKSVNCSKSNRFLPE